MIANLKELYRYRELLFMIAYRDIRVRYKQSVMGFLWAILMPVLVVVSGVVVRYGYSLAAHAPFKTADIAAVAVKSLLWAFLVSSTKFACNSLVGNKELVTKIYFPKEIFPLAAVLACLFDLAIASVALIILLAIVQIGWSAYLLWLPVLLVSMVVFVIGVSMIVSASSLFFRDVKYIVEVLLTFGIFFTPVFYDVRMFGDQGKWLLLNPAAPLLDGLGSCVIFQQQPRLVWIAYSCTFAVAMLWGGYVLFKRLETAFAESL